MIERIFIPTVHRVNDQITYANLPDELKSRVVMVVQAWERDKYTYPCEYLVLPDTEEYHFSNYYCLPNTRKAIYEAGKTMKYAMMDDDMEFHRRNSKYFGGPDNMGASKRPATDEDMMEMFDTFDTWLDLTTICGCAQVENPPGGKLFRDNTSISSAFWINGTHFADLLPKLDLTRVRVAEDVFFLLCLLLHGYANRVSEEFVQTNVSNKIKMPSTVWDQQTYEQTLRDHQIMEKTFPGIYTIMYDEDGKRTPGGYKGFGKSKIRWSKAFNESANLARFFE